MRQGSKSNAPPDNLRRGGKFYQGKGALIEPDITGSCGAWFTLLCECLGKIEVTREGGPERIGLDEAMKDLIAQLHEVHRKGGKVIFVGNGGSAAIASHMAVDYSKNGGIRSLAFNDAAMLTCLANDYGYQNVFAKQIEYHGKKGDAIVIVSSSGRSLNIIAAADEARKRRFSLIVTLTGMNPNNVLRAKGSLNFYVPSTDYGLVELSHLVILHAMVGR